MKVSCTKNVNASSVQLIRDLQKWAMEMGAPNDVLQDLCKLEGSKKNLHKAFSGQRGEMWKHIIKHVKPLHEAENIKKTVALHKVQQQQNPKTKTPEPKNTKTTPKPQPQNNPKTEDNGTDVSVKSSVGAEDYLLLKEKHEKIKKLKNKCRQEEEQIMRYRSLIDKEICRYEHLSQDVNDTVKKAEILKLKNKSFEKQIEQWNETKELLERLHMRCVRLKQADKSTKEAEMKNWNDICSVVSKMLGSMDLYGKEKEEIAGFVDQLVKDVSVWRFKISSKAIVAALTEIVSECHKTIIKLDNPDLKAEDFNEYRKGTDEHLNEMWQLHKRKSEEIKKLKDSVERKKANVKVQNTELKELIERHVCSNVFIGDKTKFKKDITDYVCERLEKRRLEKVNSFIRENIVALTHETDVMKSRNENFHKYCENRESKLMLLWELQNYLRTQSERLKYHMDEQYKSSLEACKQPDYITLKGIDMESVKDILLQEVEVFLQTPLKVINRSWEDKTECLQTEARQKLSRTCDLVQGPNHIILGNILESLVAKKTIIEFEWKQTCVPTMYFTIDASKEDVKQQREETEKGFTDQSQTVTEKLSKAKQVIENIESVIETWSEQHFNNWIPGNVELNGKKFADWKDWQE